MEYVQLYEGPQLVQAESVEPLALDDACTRCSLHKDAPSVCAPGATFGSGPEPPLLCVLPHPLRTIDHVLAGTNGNFLQKYFSSYNGPVTITYAIRCAPKRTGGNAIHKSHYQKCAPYLASIYAGRKYSRVFLFGSAAAKVFLGRGVAVHANSHNYTVLRDGTPVFIFPEPAAVAKNKFKQQAFEIEFESALNNIDGYAVPFHQPPWDAKALLVRDDEESLTFAREWLASAPWVAFDVETYGAMFTSQFRVTDLGVSKPDSDTCLVWTGDQVTRGPAYELAKEFLSGPIPKRGQNAKYDMQACREHFGVDVWPVDGDTRLWLRQLNTEADASLDAIGELFAMGGHKAEADGHLEVSVKKVQDAAKHSGFPIDKNTAKRWAYFGIPDEVRTRYVARDAYTTMRAAEGLEENLKNYRVDGHQPLWETWNRTLMPLNRALVNMERAGAAVNMSAVPALRQYLDHEIEESRKHFVPYGVDPNSGPQLAKLLYETLELPCRHTTGKGAPSTAAKALKALAGQHPIVDHLLRYRKVSKYKSTYVDAFTQFVRDDGRIHPTFKIDGTGSGRLSAANPNLQNQPKRGEIAKKIRNLFVAPKGKVLIQADYSTLEIRVAAFLANDPVMKELLADPDVDFHLQTAMLVGDIWDMTPEGVKAAHLAGEGHMRQTAKTVNFGTLYGQGVGALAEGTGLTQKKAAAAQQAILGRFNVLRAWLDECKRYTMDTGTTWTYWDGKKARVRRLYGAASPDGGVRSNALNASFNTPIQGTASDFMLMSIAGIDQWLREESFPGIQTITVHDSTMLEVDDHPAVIDEAVHRMDSIMQSWPSGGVKMKVDFEVGHTWGDMSDYAV